MFTSDTDEHAVKRHHALTARIQQEADRHAGLTFARFMELALYAPGSGYYEQRHKSIGRRGDFFTSVSVGRLFGELLACQFAAQLDQPDIPAPTLVEAGAHDGALAADILSALATRHPALFDRLHYVLLEPSATREAWQRERLARFGDKVAWVESWTAASSFLDNQPSHRTAVIFANELLDALPVHRLRWRKPDHQWTELNVRWEAGQFEFFETGLSGEVTAYAKQVAELKFDEACHPLWPRLPGALLDALPDRFTIEISPAAWRWWQTAAAVLKRGWLATFDYGLAATETWAPQRHNGTVRGYLQHHRIDDVLAVPGAQDLTAHINFTALQLAGENAGLTTQYYGSQGEFLTQVVRDHWPVATTPFAVAEARQFQTLTHPQHLGRAFRVLVQSRGVRAR